VEFKVSDRHSSNLGEPEGAQFRTIADQGRDGAAEFQLFPKGDELSQPKSVVLFNEQINDRDKINEPKPVLEQLTVRNEVKEPSTLRNQDAYQLPNTITITKPPREDMDGSNPQGDAKAGGGRFGTHGCRSTLVQDFIGNLKCVHGDLELEGRVPEHLDSSEGPDRKMEGLLWCSDQLLYLPAHQNPRNHGCVLPREVLKPESTSGLSLETETLKKDKEWSRVAIIKFGGQSRQLFFEESDAISTLSGFAV
jgi:hypothetical protein